MPNLTLKNGSPSAYGFACGYVQQVEYSNDFRLALYQEHTVYQIRGFEDFNGHICESFDNLKDARKFFKNCSRIMERKAAKLKS